MLSCIAFVIAATVAPPGMTEAGVRAAKERRFCDASSIFVQLHGLTHEPLSLYRAAETAFAAGDFLAAIRLYRTLLDNHPQFERAAVVQTRVDELLVRVRDFGPGETCALPPRICGDWVVSPGEGCDDGNLIDGDGCDATCMPTGCGNGVRTADEVCDDGNIVNGDGCDANCTFSVCGNGAVAVGEVCDDGNSVDGDGCDANCTLSVCGNGVRASGEGCDDGNLESGDGCSSACMIEAPPEPFPVVGVAVGGAAALVGGVGIGVGMLPLSWSAQAEQDIRAAEALSSTNPQTALERARAAQTAQEQAQQAWQTWGLPLTIAGSVAVVAGVVVAVGAVVLYFMPDVPPETDTPPPASSDARSAP